jgi:hypothetical protein
MVNIQNENTFKKACTEGINLFLGSGFSLLAKDVGGRALPTGAGLLSELTSEFKLDSLSSLTLAQVCTVLEAESKDALYAFLKRRFSVTTFDPRYKTLEDLSIKTIFTTNIDNLLFKVFAESTRNYLNDLSVKGPAFTDRSAIDFIALHGSIVHPGEALEFSSTNLAASFSADPDKWHYLTGQLQKRPTLFWGYSLGDAGTLQALNPSTTKGRVHQDKWIALYRPTTAASKHPMARTDSRKEEVHR